MTTLAPAHPRHWFYAVPILGWIARDVAHGSDDTIWYALIIALTALVLAVKTWGLVALGLTALAFVPLVFLALILITVGK